MSNLYGWARSEYLPCGEFKSSRNVDGFNVNSISEKSEIGYFLEADLEYPDELHQLHNGYPIVPENLLFLVICWQNTEKKLLINME